jgi:transcription elongation GreA/GreB family factor
MGRIVAWLDALKAKPIDEAYLVNDSEEIPSPTSPMAAAQVAEKYLDDLDEIIAEEGAVEVQVGDKVTFFNLTQDKESSVIIGTQTDETRGILDYRTPLADALLGLQIGEIGPMIIPGRSTARLRVLKIERVRDRKD